MLPKAISYRARKPDLSNTAISWLFITLVDKILHASDLTDGDKARLLYITELA
jgi:hypothetical protein